MSLHLRVFINSPLEMRKAQLLPLLLALNGGVILSIYSARHFKIEIYQDAADGVFLQQVVFELHK